jgi:hypothetical protein
MQRFSAWGQKEKLGFASPMIAYALWEKASPVDRRPGYRQVALICKCYRRGERQHMERYQKQLFEGEALTDTSAFPAEGLSPRYLGISKPPGSSPVSSCRGRDRLGLLWAIAGH